MVQTTYELTVEGFYKCPECDYTAKTARGIGRHRVYRHGYVAPKLYPNQRKETRKKRRRKATVSKLAVSKLATWEPERATRTPYGTDGATLIVFERSGAIFLGYPADISTTIRREKVRR